MSLSRHGKEMPRPRAAVASSSEVRSGGVGMSARRTLPNVASGLIIEYQSTDRVVGFAIGAIVRRFSERLLELL